MLCHVVCRSCRIMSCYVVSRCVQIMSSVDHAVSCRVQIMSCHVVRRSCRATGGSAAVRLPTSSAPGGPPYTRPTARLGMG